MRILIGCEFSGVVRDAFCRLGHDCWSCDLLPTERDGNHIEGDVIEVIASSQWDMLIVFPPCTHLCISGARWFKGKIDEQKESIEFVRKLMGADIPKICVENPVGVISTKIRKPDQIIQPWMFGDDASKKTCLWLKNLPKLEWCYQNCLPPKGYRRVMCDGEQFCQDDVHYIERDGVQFASRLNCTTKPVWGNQTPSGQNKLGPSENRAKERSRTYSGIAQAMADQWG